VTLGRPAPAVVRRGIGRRLWDAPLRFHLLGLALVLLVAVPIVGTDASFSSDEGAAIIQGRSLASGGGWIVEHPMPEVDPDGRMYPLISSERGSNGWAPLAKHPAYSLLVAGAGRLGGVTGMVLLSLAGTVAAAGLAAALAARLDPVLSRATIWVVGLASPLFFDGFLIMGHTLGAALAVGATLCAVRAISDRRPAMALAVAAYIAGAVLLRTEAVLFALSLAAVAAVIALRDRPRPHAFLVAGGALAGAVVARYVETAWLARIIGDVPSSIRVPAPIGADGFLQGRLEALFITWLLPGYDASPVPIMLLLAMVVGVVSAAIEARRETSSPARVLVPAAFAGCAAVAAIVVGPAAVVPGLLVAFPVLTAGVLVLRWSLFRDVGATLALATSALFALGVIVTQYSTGGTGEWGGRYFALAIPVVAPVLLLGLYRHGQRMEQVARRGAAGALVVCSVAMTGTALLSLRSEHRYWADLIRSIEQAEDVAGPGRPVVTTWQAVPRYAWAIFDRSPWLLVERADIGDLRESIVRAGSDRFVFVTASVTADRPWLEGLDIVWSARDVEGRVDILVLQRPTAPLIRCLGAGPILGVCPTSL
jgi:hypothetical protein